MNVAIYSRKSKFTEKGESIENQIQLCKEYAINHFGITEKDIKVFEDEGFSGGNTDRPQFQLMLREAKNKKFSTLVCYRLDRVSRNISDFSTLIDNLEKLSIGFVSIREQFDTTTPMGRAMMYIASVFAQLERETIAERIKDNMLQLSKTGRWLGGNTPTGYMSEPVEIFDKNGQPKRAYKLIPIETEVDLVKLLYSKYLELNSLRKLETYCVQNDVQSKNNRQLSRFALTTILTNPVYVCADESIYNYFIDNGYEVYSAKESFNGVNGIMTYNKTNDNTQKIRDISEWVIAIGAHEGFIKADEWLKVQNIFHLNKDKSFRKVRNSQSLLSGLLKCSNCRSFMRPKSNFNKKYGDNAFVYMCEMKEISKKTKCSISNVTGNVLDEIVVDEIKQMTFDGSHISEQLNAEETKVDSSSDNLKSEINHCELKIKANEQAIQNLVSNLEVSSPSMGVQYIMKRIEELDKQNTLLKSNLDNLINKLEVRTLESNNLSVTKSMLEVFTNTVDNASIDEKRRMLRLIIKELSWDGENILIDLFGCQNKKRAVKTYKNIPLGDPCR